MVVLTAHLYLDLETGNQFPELPYPALLEIAAIIIPDNPEDVWWKPGGNNHSGLFKPEKSLRPTTFHRYVWEEAYVPYLDPKAMQVNRIDTRSDSWRAKTVRLPEALRDFCEFCEAWSPLTLRPVGWRVHYEHHWLMTLYQGRGPHNVDWKHQLDLATWMEASHLRCKNLKDAHTTFGHIDHEQDWSAHTAMGDAMMSWSVHRNNY